MSKPGFVSKHHYPLSWPGAWPRTPEKKRLPPKDNVTHYLVARDYVEREFRAIGTSFLQISSNLPPNREGEPFLEYLDRRLDDPGIAASFVIGDESYVMACDAWEYPKDNLRAIGLVLGHLRAAARNAAPYYLPMLLHNFSVGRAVASTLPAAAMMGISEDAVLAAEVNIPPPLSEEQVILGNLAVNANPQEWWSILQLEKNSGLSEIEAAFRRLARFAHPDRGGDAQKMRLLTQAVTHARQNRKMTGVQDFYSDAG